MVDVLALGGAELGHLEGTEDPAAQLEGVVDALHAGGELGELVVAEVGLAGAGGHDQRVVRRHGLAAEDMVGDRAGLQVDVGDLAEHHRGVALLGQDLPRRRGDLALGEDAGRHLVEQRLEEVVRGLRDHGHVDVGPAQGLGAEQAAEAGADHHDLVPAWVWRCELSVFTSDITSIVPAQVPGQPRGGRLIGHTTRLTIASRRGVFRHDGEVTHYDLAVIGTGSGNTIVNKRFADWRVAILEDNVFGGTCLNVGCIPTKMFVYPADLARDAQRGPDLGVDTSYDGARWPEIRDRIFGRIDPIAASGRAYRKRLPNVDVYEGHATFVEDHTLDTGTGEQITADQIVIAAGSRVSVPDVPGLDEVGYHTSDTVMRLDELPERMVIVGGGYVAAEFAHVFSALGTRVTLVHRGPTLLRHHDEAVSHQFTELAGRQWDLRLGTSPSKVERRGDATVVTLTDGSELEADVLLMATGRVLERRPPRPREHLDRRGGRAGPGGRVPARRRSRGSGRWATSAAPTSSSTSPTTRPTRCSTTCCTPAT